MLSLDVGFIRLVLFHLYPKNKNGMVKVYVAIFFATRDINALM
jgi:hypothetical protein